MAFEDLSGILGAMPDFLRALPLLILIIQIISYVFLIMFFGSIIIKGYRGYLDTWVKFLLRIALGFISLICGIGFTFIFYLIPFLEWLNTGFYSVLQLNIILGGLISACILTLCAFLISHNIFNITSMKKSIKRLEEKLKRAEETQKRELKKSKRKRLLEPLRIAGIVLVVIFLVFALANFRGFPNILESIGLSEDELEGIADNIENLNQQLQPNIPQGCVSILSLTERYRLNLLEEGKAYDNNITKKVIEDADKSKVLMMREIPYNNKTIILAVTQNQNLCSALKISENEFTFCECVSTKF